MEHRDNLYLVVLRIEEPVRRRKLRSLCRPFGAEVLPDVVEVAGGPTALRSLMDALAPHLGDHDDVRIYPVCPRCQDRAKLHGTEALSTLPVAWFF